jgi:hypothetical protein
MIRMPQFGDVLQLGYVPTDFRQSLHYWSHNVGAGPFFVRENLLLKGWRYLGQAVDINITVAIGYWGELQIELIQQNCDTQSVYKAFRENGREGLHHIGIDCTDAAAARSQLAEARMAIIQEVDGPTGGMFYAAIPDCAETMLEFLCLTAAQRQYFSTLRDAHRTWDGSNPVR